MNETKRMLAEARERVTCGDFDRFNMAHAFNLLRRSPQAGVRIGSAFSNTFIGPLPANANETLVFTTGPVGLAVDNAAVLIFWMACITAGTTVTLHNYRLRRGTLVTSPLVNATVMGQTVAATNAVTTSGCYADQPGVAAALQYSLTVAQGGATAAGTFVDGMLIAAVL
jgi:hypothetical protein